jgi:hypothetical protein
MFTTRHYRRIADSSATSAAITNRAAAAAEFAAMFEADNPRFNRERFMQACGV